MLSISITCHTSDFTNVDNQRCAAAVANFIIFRGIALRAGYRKMLHYGTEGMSFLLLINKFTPCVLL